MPGTAGTRPFYPRVASWFCLPSFLFGVDLLLETLGVGGDSAHALGMLFVLLSTIVAPWFTLAAVGIGVAGHFMGTQRVSDRRMWRWLALAVAANLALLSASQRIH